MKKRHILMGLVGSLILMLAAIAAVFHMSPPDTLPMRDDGYIPVIGGHAPMAPATFDRVSRYSDIAALGTVTAKSSDLAPCCDSLVARLPGENPQPVRLVDTITFEIMDLYKGSGQSTLTVQTHRPGGNVRRSGDSELALLQFEVGQQYVLFLVERADHYVVQGVSKGHWAVNGDTAVQAGTGESYTKTQLRDKVASHQ